MAIHVLTNPPPLAGLYARALRPAVPGLGNRGATGPDSALSSGGGPSAGDTLALPGTTAEPGRLEAYRQLCGFGRSEALPATYPQVLAFRLQLLLMTAADFPIPVLGAVHVANRIEVRRPIGAGETFDLAVHTGPLAPHAKGLVVSVVTEVLIRDEWVWRAEAMLLKRGVPAAADPATEASAFDPARDWDLPGEEIPGPIRWHLSANLGRRYARVSDDRNPIHLSALSAKAFGFRRQIAHGMWTKARAVAELEPRLPDAYRVDVVFRKPVFLPSTVTFGARDRGSVLDFAVSSPRSESIQLSGRVTRSG